MTSARPSPPAPPPRGERGATAVTGLPSPLAGEGGTRRSRVTDEGAGLAARDTVEGVVMASAPPSPPAPLPRGERGAASAPAFPSPLAGEGGTRRSRVTDEGAGLAEGDTVEGAAMTSARPSPPAPPPQGERGGTAVTGLPSPLAGEGGTRRSRVTDEGAGLAARDTVEGVVMASAPPSPPTPLPRGERGATAVTGLPSPLAGEGGARHSRVTDEGATVARARALRRTMTDAERKLWTLLRDRRLAGAKFRRQVPIGPYVADFLSYPHRIVVEADGGQHAESARDTVRDRWLGENGFRVFRFWNTDVLANPEGVLTALLDALASSPSPPAPLPQGERGGASGPSPRAGEGGARPSRVTDEGERRTAP
ncbi:MAG: endonuclease domain-containing protein [Pseudomonadota bacterium]